MPKLTKEQIAAKPPEVQELIQIMDREGLRAKDVAEILDVQFTTVNTWRSGSTKLSAGTLDRLRLVLQNRRLTAQVESQAAEIERLRARLSV